MANLDLIVHNGKIYTSSDPRSRVEALSISGGRIHSTGAKREILRLRSASTETLDLEGRVALPGLSDSHIHLLGTGMLMRTLDLSRARSILEIQKTLAEAASKKRTSEWIVGRGWDQEKLRERRYPDRSDLDIIGNPVFLRRVCGHVAVANSSALRSAGITGDTTDPLGGEIERDSTGNPDGVLKERALELVARLVPRDEGEVRQALLVAAEKMLANGVTSMHCIIEDALEFKVIRDLKREGKVAQAIYAILPLSMLEDVHEMKDRLGTWDDGFRVGGLKLFLDGSLGARTAALATPYNDEPGSSGMLTMSKEQLLSVIRQAREQGLQLCLHAIGDRAVEIGIEALGEVLGPQDCLKLRPRIEHASLLPPELIRKMTKLGIVASVQPRFIYSDSWAEKRLGPTRIQHLYPFKSMLRAGIHVAAGSDSPSDNSSAVEGLWSAVCRPGLPSKEQLDVSETLSCYTTGASYASFSETSEGTLAPGKWANMVVFDRDPFECPWENLFRLRVVHTIVRGRVFHWN